MAKYFYVRKTPILRWYCLKYSQASAILYKFSTYL